MRPLLHAIRVARSFTSGLPRRTSSDSAINFQDARPFDEIPGPKGKYNLPGIGMMFHFKPFGKFGSEDFAQFYDELHEKYGPMVRIRMIDWTILIEDPKDMETIIRHEGRYPNRMTFLLMELFSKDRNVPDAIGNLQGEEWHKARIPLNSLMMRTNSAQHYLQIQNEVADDLVTLLKKPMSALKLRDLFYRYATESISAVSFNKRLGFVVTEGDIQPEQKQILRDLEVVLDATAGSFRVHPAQLKYTNPKLKKRFYESAYRVMKSTDEYYRDAVDVIKQQEKDGTLVVDKHNFMMSLMTSGKVSPENMSGIAFSLFVAGTDSTARTLQMVLYNLARNPDKQEKLYEEIHNTMGRSGPLTVEALTQMTYLPACLRESYRTIYPLINGTQRFLPEDIVLRGYRVPAGTSVLMMNQRTSMNPEYFPNPKSFIPERWLRDESGKRDTDIPSAAVRPFGFGKRMCLGKRFAEQEIYLAVSKILQNFRVSLPADEKLVTDNSPFTGPKVPLNFIFTTRN